MGTPHIGTNDQRVLRNLLVAALGQHLTGLQHRDLVTEFGNDFHIVFHHQHGAALGKMRDQVHDRADVFMAQARHRFIQQDQLRLHGDGGHQLERTLAPVGQLGSRCMQPFLQPHAADQGPGTFIELVKHRLLTPADLVQRGVVQVMEGRHCFAHLTIEENLLTGSYTRTDKGEISANLEKVYNYFPRLKTRRTSQAAYTSGGEQQMCAIGRALMANPSLVLLDEPSMGLAPQIVEEVFNIVKDLNHKEQVTFLLAEQNTNMALRYADFGYIMESGRIVMDGAAADLASNEDVKEFYLGMGGGERKSFKDVKSYKRRKRWLA